MTQLSVSFHVIFCLASPPPRAGQACPREPARLAPACRSGPPPRAGLKKTVAEALRALPADPWRLHDSHTAPPGVGFMTRPGHHCTRPRHHCTRPGHHYDPVRPTPARPVGARTFQERALEQLTSYLIYIIDSPGKLLSAQLTPQNS